MPPDQRHCMIFHCVSMSLSLSLSLYFTRSPLTHSHSRSLSLSFTSSFSFSLMMMTFNMLHCALAVVTLIRQSTWPVSSYELTLCVAFHTLSLLWLLDIHAFSSLFLSLSLSLSLYSSLTLLALNLGPWFARLFTCSLYTFFPNTDWLRVGKCITNVESSTVLSLSLFFSPSLFFSLTQPLIRLALNWLFILHWFWRDTLLFVSHLVSTAFRPALPATHSMVLRIQLGL